MVAPHRSIPIVCPWALKISIICKLIAESNHSRWQCYRAWDNHVMNNLPPAWEVCFVHSPGHQIMILHTITPTSTLILTFTNWVTANETISNCWFAICKQRMCWTMRDTGTNCVTGFCCDSRTLGCATRSGAFAQWPAQMPSQFQGQDWRRLAHSIWWTWLARRFAQRTGLRCGSQTRRRCCSSQSGAKPCG